MSKMITNTLISSLPLSALYFPKCSLSMNTTALLTGPLFYQVEHNVSKRRKPPLLEIQVSVPALLSTLFSLQVKVLLPKGRQSVWRR